MAISLTAEDHDTLDKYLEKVLTRVRVGEETINDARHNLAEAFSLVAKDDHGFRDYMRSVIDQ